MPMPPHDVAQSDKLLSEEIMSTTNVQRHQHGMPLQKMRIPEAQFGEPNLTDALPKLNDKVSSENVAQGK